MSSSTNRTVTHSTFTIERVYPVSPERVFAAFADQKLKRRWFAVPDHWVDSHYSLDFGPGGSEISKGGPPGGPVHLFEARYHDIVDKERIVYSYDLYVDDKRISVSVATIELLPDPTGTKMMFTEQGAFFDGPDDPVHREEGTQIMVDELGKVLVESA